MPGPFVATSRSSGAADSPDRVEGHNALQGLQLAERRNRLWSLPDACEHCERLDVVSESNVGAIEPRRRAVPTVDVETALADVTKRLTKRFEGQVPPDIVAATVRSCASRWTGARVVEFVPLLTERRSIEQLRGATAEAAEAA